MIALYDCIIEHLGQSDGSQCHQQCVLHRSLHWAFPMQTPKLLPAMSFAFNSLSLFALQCSQESSVQSLLESQFRSQFQCHSASQQLSTVGSVASCHCFHCFTLVSSLSSLSLISAPEPKLPLLPLLELLSVLPLGATC